jgi:hypothetical protein
MTIELTRRRTTRKIKCLKEDVSIISPDYSDCATPDFLVHSYEWPCIGRRTTHRPASRRAEREFGIWGATEQLWNAFHNAEQF